MKNRYPAFRSILRRMSAVLLAAVLSAAGSGMTVQAYAQEYISRSWMDTSVTFEQYAAVVNVLRANAGQDTGGQNSIMFDTGVTADSADDGFQLCYDIRSLFPGRDDFAVCYNEQGLSAMTAEIIESSEHGLGVRFHAVGETQGTPTLFAGWLPGSDPAECLRQHDAALAVLQQVAANAPADDAEAYRYFFDWLCANVTFDDEYRTTSHSVYSAVVEGCSVCEGYARAFEVLCWMTGRYCRNVTVQGEGQYGTHERNLVILNGEPKWVDVAWGDQPGGPNYGYLLYDVDYFWRQQLGL